MGKKHDFITPKVLSFITTYRCTAACEECCFGCSPSGEGTLSYEEMEEAMIAAHRLGGLRAVVFTGGECFLLKEDLTRAVQCATDLGLQTRCVTNGYWAKSPETGRERVAELVDAGLKELNISTGDQHQKFVSLETVENAAVIAVEAGLLTRIVVEETAQRACTAQEVAGLPKLKPLLAVEPAKGENKPLDIIESPWMPMDHDRTIEQSRQRTLNREKLSRCQGCSSIFSTVVRSPDDEGFGLCCGLSRKEIGELNRPFEASAVEATLQEAGEDFLKIWLHVEGPERILAWAAGKEPEIVWEERYAHQCHACLALFRDPLVSRTLLAHYHERLDDVLLRYSMSLHAQELLEADTFN